MIAAWAISIVDLPAELGHIFYFIVLPMLVLIGLGWLLQCFGGLDLATLRRLNFYFVMPGIIYFSVVTSRLEARQVGTVVLFVLALLACMTALTLLVARLRRLPAPQRGTMLLTTILFNSGNFGLPLQDRAFAATGRSGPATALQAVVMITQNVFTFTVGIFIAAGSAGRRHWKANLLHILKLPPIYALAAGVVTAQVREALGPGTEDWAVWVQPWWKAVLYVKGAFIAVALVTLGAQLATVRRGHARYPVAWSVGLRLLGGPALAVGLIYLFGLDGFLAQVLLIASASPTAVNCMLLCMEFDSQPDYAAAAVFYSTLLSPVTVTGAVFLAQGGILPGL